MGKRLWSFIAFCTLAVGMAFAQQNVTGTVIEAQTGEPVVGASVVVVGSNHGTYSDANGNFTLLNVPSSAKTLKVTYVGMKEQTVPVRSKVRVYLEDAMTETDEVLVVAFGTAKKSAFTGSAKVVGSEVIAETQKTNVVDALNGRVAGVQMYNATGQPGQSDPVVRIRGISSINAGNKPLYIVDGAPYDGDINNLNPADIESMTVQKDAASNALYGARGANGVIMITTKRARVGEQPRITVDAKWGTNMRAAQRYKTINNPAQYYETYFAGLQSYFLNQGNSAADAFRLANENLTAANDYGLNYNVYTVPTGQYLIGTNGKLNPNATMGRLVNYKGQDYWLTADDWYDNAYERGLRQEYNVQAVTSSDRNTFFASFGYLNNEGISAHSNYERFTARVYADSQLKDWFKLGVMANFAHFEANSLGEDGVSNSSGNVFAAATQIAPIYPLFIRDGNGNIIRDDYGNVRYDYGDKQNAGMERPPLTSTNALSDAILDTNKGEGNAFNGAATAEITFLRDFRFTSVNTINLDETRFSSVTNPFYGTYSSSNGILGKTHVRSFDYNFQQVLNWHHQFNRHDFEVTLGHETTHEKYYYLYAGKSNMFDPSNNELAMAITDGSNNSYTTHYNNEGYFSRLMYNYDEKYFLSGSFRRDASSRFHPDHRWGNFWSASAAWIISREKWFPHNAGIDMLKAKVSYGSQGNDNIDNYLYTNTYSITNANGYPGLIPGSMGNENITWETIGSWNAGIEFEALKGRISGSIDYFYRKTTDMLSWYPLPASYGYTGYYANVGDMRNTGVELDLTGHILRSRDFDWSINLNFTHYKNKITKLDEQRKNTTIDGVDGYESGDYFYGEGRSLYTFNMRKYAGVCQEYRYDKNGKTIAEPGQALYYHDVYDDDPTGYQGLHYFDENGVEHVTNTTANPSEADYHLIGSALPDAYGGFGTSFRWKNLDFSINFAYQIGGLCYDSDYQRAMASPTTGSHGYVMHADILKAWTPENTDSNIPRFMFGDQYSASTSDRFLTDASYLSLQNINLGYTLPQSLTRRISIEKLRVYVAADNVWLWSKRQGLDPRQSIAGSTTSSYYSPIRTISGGITVTF